MSVWEELTAEHIDVMREIGNIGAGNAATALAQMVGTKIDMEVPQAGVVPFETIYRLIGAEDEVVSCINFAVSGPAPSHILLIFDQDSSYALIDMLLGQPPGRTTALDEMGMSVLAELGNILTGSFLNAFAEFTRLTFTPSVPALAYDMLGAVLSTALLEGGYFEDRALIIETQFLSQDTRLSGHFFLLPESGSLKTILSSLGILL